MYNRRPSRYYKAAAAVGGVATYAAKRLASKAVDTGVRAYQSRKSKAKAVPKPTSRAKVVKVQKSLTKKVKELKIISDSNMGTQITRVRATGTTQSAAGAMALVSLSLNDTAKLESAIATLQYYDPSTPATLLEAAGATGTFQKEFYFKRSYSRLTLRNNYQVPVNLKVYICTPKDDTNLTCQVAFTQGLADMGNPTNTSPLVHLTDSIQFNDLYTIVKSKSELLEPGEGMVCNHAGKPFQYDPSFVDSHALSFQKKYMSVQYVIRVEGVIGHDSVDTGDHNILGAGVDWIADRTYEIRYAAGADLHNITIADGADTFANVGLISNKPLADNQSFSLA